MMKFKLRSILFVIAVVLTACAPQSYNENTAVRFAFPSVDVAGRCWKQMTVDDIRQIKKLAHDRSDILKPIDQIIADKPDEAEVKSGSPKTSGDPMTTFQVRKKDGRWFIIGKPYTSKETIITG